MCLSELKRLSNKYDGYLASDIETMEQMCVDIKKSFVAKITEMSVEALRSGSFGLDSSEGFNISDALKDIKDIERLISEREVTLTKELKPEEVTVTEEVVDKVTVQTENEIMVNNKRSGSDAYGIFNKTDETILVLKGAKCRIEEGKAFRKHIREIRQQSFDKGELVKLNEEYYELTVDKLFASVADAGSFVTGGAICEYKDWSDENGIKLNIIMGKNSRNPFGSRTVKPKKEITKKLGRKVFHKSIQSVSDELGVEYRNRPGVVYTVENGAKALGMYSENDDKLTVLKGSLFVKNNNTEMTKSAEMKRLELLREGALMSSGDRYYVATQDIEVDNPAQITNMLVNNTRYWKDMWRTEEGQTLKTVDKKRA